MKKTFLLLTLLALCSRIYAQDSSGSGQEQTVTFQFVVGDDMFYTAWKGNDAELERLYSLVEKYRSEISSGTVPVYVHSYSPTKSLSFIRANRVKSELIIHKGLTEDNFITKNYATYTAPDGMVYKDMVVVTLRIPVKPEPVQKPEPTVYPEPEPIKKPDPIPEPEYQPAPEPVLTSEPRKEHAGLYLRTNLLYDALLTPTMGIEWRINDNIGIKLDGSWAHWDSSHGRVQKLWLLSPEVRWYLLDAKRFYVGLGLNIGEANIYKGLASVLSTDTGYQGNIYGGGLTVGYNLALNKCLSMDFNLGLGLTHFSYDTFYISNKVRVYNAHDQSKNFWGPTQAGVSLVWRMADHKNK